MQAVSFGAAHGTGLSGGVAGMVGATVFGVVLGMLRNASAGLTAPVIAHTLVDLVLFSLAVEHVVWRV
nr:CPBP family glutamic-type intramembrane protease [Frankia sp. Cppng1_Ct_nod]